jgi:xylulokinase
MEGTCYAYAALRDTLGIGAERLYVVGGGAQSPLWMQILADVMGCPVGVVAAPGDAAARGAALLVAPQVGWSISAADPAVFPVAAVYEPNAALHQRYRQWQAIFQELYPALRASFARMAAVGR